MAEAKKMIQESQTKTPIFTPDFQRSLLDCAYELFWIGTMPNSLKKVAIYKEDAMNYIIYGKHKDDKSFGAMDLANGTVGVGLVFATLIPDLERAKGYVDKLTEMADDYTFQVRGAGTAKVFYTKGINAGNGKCSI